MSPQSPDITNPDFMPNSHEAHMESATGNAELTTAFVGIASGITRPKSVQRRLEDAARGRLRNPLGSYQLVAEECAKAGGSWFHISRPLYVQLARLRQICFGGKSLSMREALIAAKKESDEAEACALTLALSVDRPEASLLAAADKELRESIIADEQLAEVIEQRLYAEKK